MMDFEHPVINDKSDYVLKPLSCFHITENKWAVSSPGSTYQIDFNHNFSSFARKEGSIKRTEMVQRALLEH